jgi:phosphatidate phosphatase APP1
MGLADIVRSIENQHNKRGIVRRRAAGWLPQILPYTGYGSVTAVRILARAVMADPAQRDADQPSARTEQPASHTRPSSRHAGTQRESMHRPHNGRSDSDDPHSNTTPRLPFIGASNPPSASSRVNEMVERATQRAVDAQAQAQRGWRQFFTTQVGYLPVTVSIGDVVISTRTDHSGYIDIVAEHHGLTPGWHNATITPAAGEAVTAPVIVVDPRAKWGIVSDVDDTILVTWLPRMLLAAWNSFVLPTDARQAVAGMPELYRHLLSGDPHAPVFYLSTGAWNTAPAMQAFIRTNHLPAGPLLLTDWGPTPTGLFRSGESHKRAQLRNLLITFPDIQWYLIGDDGQHDPFIYDELARDHPSRIRAIALRELNPVEQVLSHGTPSTLENREIAAPPSVPVVRGRDGFEILEGFRARSAAEPSA